MRIDTSYHGLYTAGLHTDNASSLATRLEEIQERIAQLKEGGIMTEQEKEQAGKGIYISSAERRSFVDEEIAKLRERVEELQERIRGNNV